MENVNWQFPAPRNGLGGVLDRLVGPGATKAELYLQFLLPVAASILVAAFGARSTIIWNGWQTLLAAFLAFDLVGGVLTNATSSAKRWFHRSEQGRRDHLRFVAAHLIHLTVVCWAFPNSQLSWLLFNGTYLLAAALIILFVARYLQRPVSLALFVGGLASAQYGVASPTGLEWFLPLFYLKLLVSHLPREEPYRPQPGSEV